MSEIRYHPMPVTSRIAVIGGGISGLAAAVYLARAGRSVTIFERRRSLGGRAATHLRYGFRFNLGPHAVFRAGASSRIYSELGVPVRGGVPPHEGFGLLGDRVLRLPIAPVPLLTSSLLSVRGKVEGAKILLRIGMAEPARFAGRTAREWLDSNVEDPVLRQLIEALIRLSTYSAETDRLSAEVMLRQLKLLRLGVTYVHEGWQKIVDALHSHAVTAGVNFVTSSHIVRVDHDGNVRGVELGELEAEERYDSVAPVHAVPTKPGTGAWIPADTVLMAVDPVTTVKLAGDIGVAGLQPVFLASLDVALSRLPNPRRSFVVGVDRPVYLAAHSRWAQLTPKGGALIHVSRYRSQGDTASEAELEALLDQLQPGWRDIVVHRRYLPAMTVSNALAAPGLKRPGVRTPVRGLYVCGDWVGDEGILSDAALSSAREAAQAILADS